MKNINVIYVDGVCNLCNGFVKLVHKNNNNNLFFSTLQKSEYKKYNLKSVVFKENNNIYMGHEAIQRILILMNKPFNFLLNFRNDADMPLYNSNLYVMDPILKEANLSGFNYIFDGLDGDVVISHGYDELSHLARNFKFKSFFSLYEMTCSKLKRKPNYIGE